MKLLARSIISVLAFAAVLAILAGTAATVWTGQLLRRVLLPPVKLRAPGRLRVLMTGTFYNANWFRSHILPLSDARTVERIYVVTDRPVFDVPKVTYCCPPEWMTNRAGRVIARGWMILLSTWRHRPDVLMGYHIMPNALLCLITANLFGRLSAYQMTGGPIQIVGGGAGAENWLLRCLRRRSRTLERLMFHLVRQFDLIVVRGRNAQKFAEQHRLGRGRLIVTGSVDPARFEPKDIPKPYDIVYVSRLVPCKGLEYFIELVAELNRIRPGIHAALVGDGPLRAALSALADKLGVADTIEFLGRREDVPEILQQSRLFALVSPSEGMSIAMLEAMGAGLPVAVKDVGELRDAVTPGRNGLFLAGDDAPADARRLAEVLSDETRLRAMSEAARGLALTEYCIRAVAARWDIYFDHQAESAAACDRAAVRP